MAKRITESRKLCAIAFYGSDARIVFSELVWKAYHGADAFGLEPVVMNGQLLIPPHNISRKFVDEYGTPSQQMDLVLFLDGSEESRTAVERNAEAFKESCSRPKWDIAQE